MRALYRSRLFSGTALLIVMAGATYACKDFLEGAPQGALDEQTLANKAGVEGSLIAAYRVLDSFSSVRSSWGGAASNWVWGSVLSDDAYKGSEATDQPGVTDLELYNWSTSGAETYLNDKWSASYEGVVRANSTIRLLNTVVANAPEEISQSDQNGIRGEALFLRAHYHFEAWRVFGNIPYYTEEDTDYRKSNVGVNALQLILNDLDEAIGLLPATPRNGDLGRVTSWTARAYKGRVQMFADDYSGALTTLRDVVNNGPYALEANFARVWTGFAQYNNGPETVLAYQASANDGEPNGYNANYGEMLNFPHSGSPFGCCGFHQPSQNIVNSFLVDANGLPLELSDPANWNARNTNLDAAASAALDLDPRLDWTAGRDDVPYKDWGPHEPGWIRAPAYGGPYSGKKIAYENASGAVSNVGWVTTQLSSMNIHILRFADVMLLLAEAEVEAGSLENARALVNQIRARAAVGAQGPGTSAADMVVPIDDPSITWAHYVIGQYPGPWTDQAYARAAVRLERKLELAMEGQRYFDLKRWGIAEQVINAYLAVEATRRPYLTAAAAYTARYNLCPIPPVQIDLSRIEGEDQLVQNPGW